jgi:hypothetical protein
MLTPARAAFLVAIAVAGTACDGTGNAVSPTSPAPVTTGATPAPTAPITAPARAPENTQSRFVTTPAASAPPSTAADRTEPPPTTEPDDDAVKQAVIDAAIESWRVFNEARLDPFNDEKVAAISDVRAGALLERSIEIIGNYRFNNEREIRHPEFPARVEPYPLTVHVDLSDGFASVEYCRIGSNIWVETGGNADGTDRIIDDTVNSYRERADLVLIDGWWLETEGVRLTKTEEAAECPDAG